MKNYIIVLVSLFILAGAISICFADPVYISITVPWTQQYQWSEASYTITAQDVIAGGGPPVGYFVVSQACTLSWCYGYEVYKNGTLVTQSTFGPPCRPIRPIQISAQAGDVIKLRLKADIITGDEEGNGTGTVSLGI
jgi:hypothetical protein